MVSDRPIKRLQVSEDTSGLTLDLRDTLAELAALPPAIAGDPAQASQYLTAYLDWRPMGSDPGRRPARRQFADAAEAALAAYAPHSPAAASLAVDIERVTRYLDGERVDRNLDIPPLPAAAQGVALVARSAADVFVPIPLATPPATALATGPIPALMPLARLADDLATYAVLLADQQEATLVFVTQARDARSTVAYGANYPFKRKAGGSQRRYQARAVAEGVREALDESGVEVLVIAGDEVITSPLDRLLHQSVADRTIGTLRLDIATPMPQIVEATLPIDEAAERGREAKAAADVRAAVSAGGLGAAGAAAVLRALQNVQVETLVMVDDFTAPGWADYAAGIAGVGDIPDEHPTGGARGQIVPIRVEDEIIRRAVATGANIEIVHSREPGPDAASAIPDTNEAPPRTDAARLLDDIGVGALLRFRSE
ncbi:MAG TPA: hypothetical protein VFU81_12750 [Thermomicrobiales bacterium]|nr:hypothetical protein [Thermomicrobiales bacterium]